MALLDYCASFVIIRYSIWWQRSIFNDTCTIYYLRYFQYSYGQSSMDLSISTIPYICTWYRWRFYYYCESISICFKYILLSDDFRKLWIKCNNVYFIGTIIYWFYTVDLYGTGNKREKFRRGRSYLG